jgi:hypothetical protein
VVEFPGVRVNRDVVDTWEPKGFLGVARGTPVLEVFNSKTGMDKPQPKCDNGVGMSKASCFWVHPIRVPRKWRR